jgi:hypothetical protein
MLPVDQRAQAVETIFNSLLGHERKISTGNSREA